VAALVALVALSLGSAAGLLGGLVSCSPQNGRNNQVRPLSAAEAQRLAAMRFTNFRDARAGVRVTYGKGDQEVRLTGWVDWSRALAYLRVEGPGAGAQRGLIQALPGVIATRQESETPTQTWAAPPAKPPADGWRVRPFTVAGPDPKPLEAYLALLFTVAAPRRDDPGLLQSSDSRWLATDKISGTPVDVILGPAVPPVAAVAPTASAAPATSAGPATTARPATSARPAATAATPRPVPSALAQLGGAVRYWLDASSRLRRFEALLPGNLSVRTDFDRTDRTEAAAIDAFGGLPVRPRAATAAEAALLARMPARDLARGGGTVSLSVATMPSANLHAAGWVDWRTGVAYVSVRDLDKPKTVTLMRASPAGVASRTVAAQEDAQPPLHPPAGKWVEEPWAERSDARGGRDLDLLLTETLGLAGDADPDPAALRDRMSWLRTDTIGGKAVTVYEILKPAERGIQRGQARFRYWIDKDGGLRRVELRTRAGSFAQLDVTPGTVPTLPRV
jgi:hypothetical protein